MYEVAKYKDFITSIFHQYYPVHQNVIASICDIAKVQVLDKGELLLPIGKVSNHIHILYQGAIVSYYLNSEGNIYHKNIFLEGNLVVSTVSALTNTPSHFALEVIEKATVISFSYKKYRQLMDENIDLKNFYIAYLEKNWVINKEKREIEIVLNHAKERYLDFITAHPNIENRVPLHYIASHLGITPTQLSRIRKKIES
ncbi:Crp/Fnr family transcriptional regulator [Aquimarina algicola]|uniref:Crp/Fnr family transcriptional regulator n=1 Tax=Aquimarina algicola TaxID=2589995 RepID=A0A504JGU8_9FLAO|nr:Crp/Fnr family transcriptional regulator [Aquimarina algicola]TPN86893.1 Crp/Fnr family transcriptional regulator [Aquimarina algicola]